MALADVPWTVWSKQLRLAVDHDNRPQEHMMQLFSIRFVALAAACGLGSLLGVSEANAANTVSVSVPFTTSPAASNGLLTGWTFEGAIPEFTTALPGVNADCLTGNTCVLTGVSLIVTDVATGSVTFTAPPNPNGSLGSFSIGSQILYTDPFTGNLVQTHASYDICNGANVSLISAPTPVCNSHLDTLSFGTNQQIQAALNNAASTSTTSTSTDPLILNALSSGPLAILDGATQSYVSGNDSNNVTSVPNVTAFVSGQVTFTYADTAPSVPEPASLTVVAVGLLGVGSARRWISRR